MITKANKKDLLLDEIICVAIGGLIRILYCLRYPTPVRDTFVYRDYIHVFNTTGLYPCDDKFPPLSLFILKIPNTLFGYDIIKGGIVVNIVISLMIILVSISIARLLTNSRMIQMAVGIIIATHPSLVSYSCQCLRENSYLLFFSLSMLEMIAYIKYKRMNNLIKISLYSSLTWLCRHEGLELLLIYPVIIFAIESKWKKGSSLAIFFLVYLVSIIAISLALDFPKEYFIDYCKQISKKWTTMHA